MTSDERDNPHQAGATSVPRVDLERAAQLLRPIANIDQPEAGLCERQFNSHAVVEQFELDSIAHSEDNLVARSLRVLPRIGQSLSNHRQHVVAEVLGYRVVHCPFEPNLGSNPQGVGQLLGKLQDGLAESARKRGVSEFKNA